MVSREPDPGILIRVQSWDARERVPRQIEQALAISWPQTTGTVASGVEEIICVGPTDWLIIASGPDAVPLLRILNGSFAGSAFRATNVSSALARIQVEGPHARALLAKGCSLDLHPQVFTPGRSARTRFAGMPVVVRCTQRSTFECIVPLSYREYLTAWLADAAVEFPDI